MDQSLLQIRTVGELKRAGYKVEPVRIEMRNNLLRLLRNKERLMPGILGYEDSVIPEIENGVLAGHHMVFLGERGQAKSRIIRSLTDLLDEWVPAVKGCEINDNPVAPICKECRRKLTEAGDDLEVEWIGPRPALRREAGHARRLDRRSDRRDRSDQGRRGALPGRRGDHPLRPHPAHQPRHLRDQRTARPDREGPGRTVQPDGREGRPDQGLQDPPADRHGPGRQRQSGGLYVTGHGSSPRSRIASTSRSAPIIPRPSRTRSRSWTRRRPTRRPPGWKCGCRSS